MPTNKPSFTRNPKEHDMDTAAQAVRDDIEEIAHQAGRYVHDLANSSEENLTQKIREKPVASLLIAAGVGFVLGALLTRR